MISYHKINELLEMLDKDDKLDKCLETLKNPAIQSSLKKNNFSHDSDDQHISRINELKENIDYNIQSFPEYSLLEGKQKIKELESDIEQLEKNIQKNTQKVRKLDLNNDKDKLIISEFKRATCSHFSYKHVKRGYILNEKTSEYQVLSNQQSKKGVEARWGMLKTFFDKVVEKQNKNDQV